MSHRFHAKTHGEPRKGYSFVINRPPQALPIPAPTRLVYTPRYGGLPRRLTVIV